MYSYKTQGTCSVEILFDLTDDNKLHNVHFVGGCHGNLQGISRLVEGMDADEVLQRLQGIRCGQKPTSCPDQLCKAIQSVKKS